MRHALSILFLMSLSACGSDRRDNGQPQQIARDKSGATLTFGSIDKVEGTRFFTLPILRGDSGNGGGSFSGPYRGSDERNRLIVDSSTGISRRVLPNTDFEIVNWIEPKSRISNTDIEGIDEAAAGDDSRPSGIYGAVVKRPVQKDNDPATYDLLFGKFEDGTQVWVSRGVAGVEAVWLTTDHKLAVVAATAKGGVFRLYDPADFHQLMEKDLAL
jgi:hypothetical protein